MKDVWDQINYTPHNVQWIEGAINHMGTDEIVVGRGLQGKERRTEHRRNRNRRETTVTQHEG